MEILRLEHGFGGSERLVREHLRRLRPSSVRPAQRTGYRPAQVLQLDWAEMPTRPRIAGRERRVYALVAALPYSGAQTAHFSFDLTLESFLEGHVRAFEFFGGVARECVYDNLRSVVARREREQVVWNQRFLHLRGHYAFHSSACTPATPREKGSVEAAVRHLKSGFWPARRFRGLRELSDQYVGWRDGVCNARIHASGRFPVGGRLSEERASVRAPPPTRSDWSGHRSVRVPMDGYLKHGRCSTVRPNGSCTSAWSSASTETRSGLCTVAWRWPATSAATSRGSGCRRRSCGPSRRRRRERPSSPRSRSRRPSLPSTRSCAREQGEGRRAAALPAGQAEGAARLG